MNLSGVSHPVKTRGIRGRAALQKDGSFLLDTMHVTRIPLQNAGRMQSARRMLSAGRMQSARRMLSAGRMREARRMQSARRNSGHQ